MQEDIRGGGCFLGCKNQIHDVNAHHVFDDLQLHVVAIYNFLCLNTAVVLENGIAENM